MDSPLSQKAKQTNKKKLLIILITEHIQSLSVTIRLHYVYVLITVRARQTTGLLHLDTRAPSTRAEFSILARARKIRRKMAFELTSDNAYIILYQINNGLYKKAFKRNLLFLSVGCCSPT